MISGCSFDLFVNICLTVLGYLPGHLHAFYLEYVYFDRREKGKITSTNPTTQLAETNSVRSPWTALFGPCSRHLFGQYPDWWHTRLWNCVRSARSCDQKTAQRILRQNQFSPGESLNWHSGGKEFGCPGREQSILIQPEYSRCSNPRVV